MSIFKEIREAANTAQSAGDLQRALELDKVGILLGSANRMWNENQDRESFRLLHTILTEAILLVENKPRKIA